MLNEKWFLESVENDIDGLAEIQKRICVSMEQLEIEGKYEKKEAAVKHHFEYVRVAIKLLTEDLGLYGVNDHLRDLLKMLRVIAEPAPYLKVFIPVIREKNEEWCDVIEKENDILVNRIQKLELKISKKNSHLSIDQKNMNNKDVPDQPQLETPPSLTVPPTNSQGNLEQVENSLVTSVPEMNFEINGQDSLEDLRQKFFMNLEKSLHQQNQQFTKCFFDGEATYLQSDNDLSNYKIVKNGYEFETQVKDFETIFLVESTEGLKMTVPKIDFDNLSEYVGKPDEKQTMIDCTRKRVQKEFSPPEFVERKSMMLHLRKFFDSKLEEISKKLENTEVSEEMKNDLNLEKKKIEERVQKLPKHDKYLIVSMAGSFCNVHIDFSATSVFYHVIVGKKIFYVAERTEENFEIYRKYEENRLTIETWIGKDLKDEWERIEINAGQTAFIPAGFLHMVFTPENSIVIGGNFLQEEFLKSHFKLTRFEDELVRREIQRKEEAFQDFWNAIFCYVKNIFIPKVKNDGYPLTVETTDRISLFINELENGGKAEWYSLTEKEEILQNLRSLTSTSTSHIDSLKRPTPSNSETNDDDESILSKKQKLCESSQS
uniref:JmjC domain-containing protein n=1 Tax=Caenorhabditis tropicalis TaxID=1561998 RepID=A0A1I7U0N8_9PELO